MGQATQNLPRRHIEGDTQHLRHFEARAHAKITWRSEQDIAYVAMCDLHAIGSPCRTGCENDIACIIMPNV